MEKNENPKTKEFTSLEKDIYPKIYQNYVNSKSFSDFQIKIEGSDTVFYTHKIILAANSEGNSLNQRKVFEEYVKDHQEYKFQKETNEDVIKLVLQFIYNGTLDYSQKEIIIPFLVLSKKV
jgi:hypothetical protein